MVTQIYTAPLRRYSPNNLVGLNTAGQAPTGAIESEVPGESQQESESTLIAIQEQAKRGVISIQSVLTDFKSTMTALGTPQDVSNQIDPYLQVVAHQAQQTQPATGLMKQNLKAAADTLDTYISSTLGQKSTVVKEWVDALLLQPIEYHSDQPIAAIPAQPNINYVGAKPLATQTEASVEEAAVEDKTWITSQLAAAKAAKGEENWPQAMQMYQGILEKGQGQLSPELAAKIRVQFASAAQSAGQPNVAIQSLETAMPNLSGPAQVKALSRLGQLYAAQGDAESAKNKYKEALTLAQEFSPEAQPYLFKSMASVAKQDGRMGTAMQWYKQSVQLAKTYDKPQVAQQAVQEMASIYLDKGNPQKAMQLLQSVINLS